MGFLWLGVRYCLHKSLACLSNFGSKHYVDLNTLPISEPRRDVLFIVPLVDALSLERVGVVLARRVGAENDQFLGIQMGELLLLRRVRDMCRTGRCRC